MGLTYTFICGGHNYLWKKQKHFRMAPATPVQNTEVLNLLSVFLIEESWF